MFIRAERTGKWNDHLEAIRRMLNLFAATNHMNYAKCARLYLQSMQYLQSNHKWLFDLYFHWVRRTGRFWVDLWPALVIEQRMMRALKSRGGLTQGRFMAESTRDLWVGTMHECASVHYAMCEVIRQHATSEQHVRCGKSSQTRNAFDLHVVVAQVSQCNPVHCQDPRLWCIVTEVATADSDDINCDEAKNVGIEINKNIDKGWYRK